MKTVDSKEFSANRLNSEPLPSDLSILVDHAKEFAERTGIELNSSKDWAPWLDTSYLSAADKKNPDIMSNVRAIAEVCGFIAFIGSNEDGEYFGYWRGSAKRAISKSPLVCLDSEGQFRLCGGADFAEALLARHYDENSFAELRGWLSSVGIKVSAKSAEAIKYSSDADSPEKLHEDLYKKYYREAGLSE